jgi:hypothetical protein
MLITIKLREDELTTDLIQSIKNSFKGREIEIQISDAQDETNYLLSSRENKKHLYKSMQEFEEGKGIVMTVAELEAKYLK